MRVNEGLTFENDVEGSTEKTMGASYDEAYKSLDLNVGKAWPSVDGQWPPEYVERGSTTVEPVQSGSSEHMQYALESFVSKSSAYDEDVESFVVGPPDENGTRLRSLEQLANIPKGEIVVLKVYANWCGYCRKMASDWASFVSEFNGKKHNGYTIRTLDVGCENPELRKKVMTAHNLTGFPSIMGFAHGNNGVQKFTFNGPRTSSGFEQFVITIAQN